MDVINLLFAQVIIFFFFVATNNKRLVGGYVSLRGEDFSS